MADKAEDSFEKNPHIANIQGLCALHTLKALGWPKITPEWLWDGRVMDLKVPTLIPFW